MKKILEMQLELQRLIAEKSGNALDCPYDVPSAFITNNDMVNYIRNQSFFMQQEVTELMEEFGGKDILKPWKANYQKVANVMAIRKHTAKSEAIDMLCFCMNICLAVGITSDTLEAEYDKVWTKNVDRQSNDY